MNELSLFTPLIGSSSHGTTIHPVAQIKKLGNTVDVTLSSPPIQSCAQNASLYYIKDYVHLCLSLANNLAQAVLFPRFCSNLLCWSPWSLAPYYTLHKQLVIFLESHISSHHLPSPNRSVDLQSTQGTSLVVQWFQSFKVIQSFHFREHSSVPGWEMKIPHASTCSPKQN